MEIVNAYALVGSFRGAAALFGTTHKTVKRVMSGRTVAQRQPREVVRNTAMVEALIADRVRASDGRISAKRLLPMAPSTMSSLSRTRRSAQRRAPSALLLRRRSGIVEVAGYTGSARNLRRAVAAAKAGWKRQRRTYRPWVRVPGEQLVIDWATEAGREIFCAVLAWSRYRFVRFADDQTRQTTLALLAECFAELGGVPSVVLSDRMACLKRAWSPT